MNCNYHLVLCAAAMVALPWIPGEAGAAPAEAAPSVIPLSQVESEINLGSLMDFETRHLSIVLKNDLANLVRISSVKTTCGCTVAELPTKEVGPGQTIPLQVVLSPGFARKERDLGTAIVLASSEGYRTIKLGGSVQPSLEVSEVAITQSETPDPASALQPAVVSLRSLTPVPIGAIRLEYPDDLLECKTRVEQNGAAAAVDITPAAIAIHEQREIDEVVRVKAVLKDSEMEIAIKVKLNPLRRVIFEPKAVNLGVVRQQDNVAGHIDVSNAQLGTGFEVTRVSGAPELDLKLSKVSAGLFRINYTIKNFSSFSGAFKLPISCETNDRARQKAVVNLIGAKMVDASCCGPKVAVENSGK